MKPRARLGRAGARWRLLALLLPLSLGGRGSARAYVVKHLTAGDPSSPVVEWAQADIPLKFEVNPVNLPWDPLLTVAAVFSGFQAWSDVLGAEARALYGGLSAIDTAAQDGHNVLVWEAGSTTLDSRTLALTTTLYDASTGIIQEGDIEFNAVDFSWILTPPADPTQCPSSRTADVQNIATHEIGHLWGMDHNCELSHNADGSCPSGCTIDPSCIGVGDDNACDTTMYFDAAPCETKKRTLECDDLHGIRFLYPQGLAFAVAPTQATNGGPVTLHAVSTGGTPFSTSSLTVDLEGALRYRISPTKVSVAPDGSSLDATFDLTGQSVGSWTLAVVNAPGSTSGNPPSGRTGPVWVTSSGGDFSPAADAGQDQTVHVGTRSLLDGTRSFTPNGGTLTYAWTIAEAPIGSKAALSSTNSATPSFQPDVVGRFVFSLVVSDGAAQSTPAQAQWTVVNGASGPTSDSGSANPCGCGTGAASGAGPGILALLGLAAIRLGMRRRGPAPRPKSIRT